ncbi:MAG: M23 family metallopeptidase [Parvularcula sp.]
MVYFGSGRGRAKFPVVAVSTVLVAIASIALGLSVLNSEPVNQPSLANASPNVPVEAPLTAAPLGQPVRGVTRVDFEASLPEKRSWPRVKPRRRSENGTVEFAIPVGLKFRAPAESVGIADMTDYTGGKTSLFDAYLDERRAEARDRQYEKAVLPRGVSFEDMLVALGARQADVAAMVEAMGETLDVDTLSAGTAIEYAFETMFLPAPLPQGAVSEEDSISFVTQQRVLARVRLRPEAREVLTAWRQSDGTYAARLETLEVEKRYAAVAGRIRNSLFASANRADVPPEVMTQFANLFLYDIDFARDIYNGDRFEAVYEAYYDTDGNFIRSGDILFGAMTWRGGREQRSYYRFRDTDTGQMAPYFDEHGESSTRLLMKTPIEGAKVTSGFGKRRHPILGYSKQHKGVDFGATRGTPIMAAGDGVIERAAPTGTYGNYVKINHANGYATAYAHMSRFAKGIAAGARVRQGQIIGYVGTTGRSTGPHLHYEVMKDGKVRNPMTLAVANGRSLDPASMEAFEETRHNIDALRLHPLTVAMATSR